MGLLDRLFAPYARAQAVGALTNLGWQNDRGIGETVFLDVSGAHDVWPLTPEQAMQTPALVRGLGLITAPLVQSPLVALDANGPVKTQPTFLYRTDVPGESPQGRMAMTIRDLILFGESLWVVERGAAGQIVRAGWCPPLRWNVTEGNILIDEQSVDSSEVLYFDAWGWDGILTAGNRTLRGARAIEDAWVSRARNPIPLTTIEHLPGTAASERLEQFEIDYLLEQWGEARRSPDGALGYLPPTLTMATPGTIDPGMFENARNAIRLDVANLLGIAATLLDGSLSTATLTYSTAEGNRNRFFDETLPRWAAPIEARLSLDDVVPRGQRVRFDLTAATGDFEPTGAPNVED